MSQIEEHAKWALSLWFPSSQTPPIESAVFDHAVMGMGLAGEALETLESATTDAPLDLEGLLKELGDTLYYWCVSCTRAGIAPESAWPERADFDERPGGQGSRAHIERSAIRLAIASGKCSEAFKKMVRDGAGPERLALGLPAMAVRFVEMCFACGFSVRDVADANRAKLAGRIARGTLRGDGNDR